MSDLYSVLKQSILDRKLRSPTARKDVYAQARTAVIRQLWTYDPPLDQDEIDQRIGEFDEAVHELEDEMVRVFAATEQPRLPARGSRKPLPPRSAPVVEGYDETTDYSPAGGGRQLRPSEDGRRGASPPARRTGRAGEREKPVDASVMAEIEEALAQRSAAIEEALRHQQEEERAHRSAPAEEAERHYEEEEEEDAYDERPLPREPDDDYRQSREAEEAYPFDRDQERYARYQPAAEEPEEYDDEAPPARRRMPNWRELSERHRIFVLLGAIGALAIVLIVLAIILLLPSGEAPPATASAASAVVEDAAAPAPQKVVGSFIVFDGKDPTVFQTGPANPVRFDDSSGDGFARISSSSADAGVRVLIGPGLAEQLAGHSIRLTVVARSAHENGAVGLRFAYQSGVALSQWATANLQPNYVSLGLTWRVPTQLTDPDGDYVLIEPGIPGDGTGADIKSIKIDLLG